MVSPPAVDLDKRESCARWSKLNAPMPTTASWLLWCLVWSGCEIQAEFTVEMQRMMKKSEAADASWLVDTECINASWLSAIQVVTICHHFFCSKADGPTRCLQSMSFSKRKLLSLISKPCILNCRWGLRKEGVLFEKVQYKKNIGIFYSKTIIRIFFFRLRCSNMPKFRGL